MKSFYKIFFIGLCFLLVSSLTAQKLVKSELLKHYTVFDVAKFRSGTKTSVDAVKIWYETNDIHGQLDTASGLLLIPKKVVGEMPFVLYQHGTTNGPQDCPSNLKGINMPMNFAAAGFVCSAADYLGMGEGRGFHPYIHAESQAWAGRDMYYASNKYCELNDIPLNDSRFVSGYSQGGHAAMALYKMLEENPNLGIKVDAAAPMSGPYNLSGVGIKELILKEKDYFSLGFLPYLVLGLQEAYGDLYNSLDEIFKPAYVAPIQSFYEAKTNLTTLSVVLYTLMTRSVQNAHPKNLFVDEVITALENKDDTNKLYNALVANDLHNWVPQVPLRMYYCEGDNTVHHLNSLVADSTMNALGAMDVESMSADLTANHSQCANFTVDLAIEFFKGIDVVTENEIAIKEKKQFKLKSKVVMNILKLVKMSSAISTVELAIVDMNGRVLMNKIDDIQEMININVDNLSAGNYVLKIKDAKMNTSLKFIKM